MTHLGSPSKEGGNRDQNATPHSSVLCSFQSRCRGASGHDGSHHGQGHGSQNSWLFSGIRPVLQTGQNLLKHTTCALGHTSNTFFLVELTRTDNSEEMAKTSENNESLLTESYIERWTLGLILLFMVRGKAIPCYETVSVLNKKFFMTKIYLKLFF